MTTALIVGGSSGIGLATARLLRAHGATVHISGRNQARLDALRASDPDLVLHRGDGTDRTAMDALCAEIGQINWLVLTMSGGDGAGPFASLDLAVLRRAFDAKFWGYATVMQAAVPYLAPEASITLVGAGSARSSIPGSAGLAAVNGAVEAMVKPLAVELAPVRVNAISPGAVDTPWWSALPAGMKHDLFASMSEALPVGRVAAAEDVAEAVALAAMNRNLTGTVIETDGGARLVAFTDPSRVAATAV